MKRKLFAILMSAAMLLSLTGCGGGEMDSATAAPESSKPESAPMEPGAEAKDSISTSTSTSTAGDSVYQRADAKLIRRCEVTLQTTEFDAAMEALYALVDAQQGYFENAYVYGGSYRDTHARRNAEYIIRVPAAHYNAFQQAIGELAYVSHSAESTEDIGAKYYDTEARVKMLRTKQDRLLSLLEKAETMEDIITLESELGEVEYEIEKLSSTLNRYDGLVSYATFTVYLNEVVKVEEPVGQKDTLSTRIKAGFTSSVDGLVDGFQDMLVWFSYNIFGVAFVVLAVLVGVVLLRSKKVKFPKLGTDIGILSKKPEDK